MGDTFYRRRLPHWTPERAVIFLTWRLEGSLPKPVIERLREEKHRMDREPERPGESARERRVRLGKKMFLRWDGALAEILSGGGNPVRWLDVRGVGELVRDMLHEMDGALYNLHRYGILPNHAHVMLEPLYDTSAGKPVELSRITQKLKGDTAYAANKILGRTGAFWQAEGFDHWVRDISEHERISSYIDENPVKAGLCEKPEDWRWSSAWEEARRA